MNSPQGAFRIAALLLAFLLLGPGKAEAQVIRYIASAIGEIVPENQSTGAFAGNTDDETSCDISLGCCFDEPGGCESPSSTSGSRVRGGAGRDEDGDGADDTGINATPGFPRTISRAGAVSIAISGNVLSLSGVQSIVDSDGEAVAGSAGGPLAVDCGVVTLTVDDSITTVIPELNVEVPVGDSWIARCERPVATTGKGLTITEVDVVVLDLDGNELLHANAIAGVELPFTTGGAGCAIAPVDGSSESRWNGDLPALFALLGLAAWRRRGRR